MTTRPVIRTEIAEALLHDLVATPSPSHEETAASRLLVNWMSGNGYDEAFVDEVGNAVGSVGSGSREIVLLGHIDTFGGELPVRIEGRTLYGRGSVDAKGPLATFAVAAAQATLPPDLRVVVIGAVEEEASTSKGARHALTQYQPDFCVIGEPSRWDRITLGYKGRLLLRWRWEGALAHSASTITSPPEHAIAYWQQVQRHVERINEGREGIFSRLDVTLQEINSGQEGAYGWAESVIGFRLPPDVAPPELATALIPAEGASVKAFGQEHTFVANKNNALSRALRQAIRAQGGRPRFVHKTGTSDMNIVGPAWNCPIVAYGPGDSALDHTPDEHIDLDEYLCAVNVLADTLARL